ncbi:MAG: terpene cyclase/mutase family protein [Gemmataceae bacterium]|nr:terpene cyclase/mutase family protein [Gemmataceae bacterium]
MRTAIFLSLFALGTWAAPRLQAQELEPEYQRAVEKGLEWLAKTQHRDGHWEGNGGQYPTAMTGLAGMALLMEGSTIREGRYSENIRRAVDWFMERSQRNGMLGRPTNQMEATRYMYGHGFGLLFLASVYGEEEDLDRRRRLEDILTRAVQFTGKAQTNRGGWGYVSSADGGGFDEGSVTITQVQALRAARNAGIVVPKSIIDNARKYLENCTTDRGGVIYSLAAGGKAIAGQERPPLTAAAVACMFNAGEYTSPLAKRWLLFCRDNISPLGIGRMGHDEYTHYYYAQALYILGDDGFAKLFPDSKPADRLTWSRYRKETFGMLLKMQNADGSWTGSGNWGYIGPVYATSIFLTIMQLDKGTLPIYQR